MKGKYEEKPFKRDRRQFLKAAGITTAITISGLIVSLKPIRAETSANTAGKRFAMVINIEKCIGCHACVASCKAENNVPLGVFRTWVEEHEKGEYPNASLFFAPKLCNQCDKPPCVQACPVKATYRREDGLVLINYEWCIGCGACIQACPYAVRYFDPVKHTADKCTFCVQRVDQGLHPACVDTCVGGARVFGDLNDPNSEVSRLVSTKRVMVLKPQLGTEPQVYYIGLDVSAAK